MSDASRNDKRFQKVAIGLALENELNRGRDDRLLRELYDNPSAEKISSTYRRLLASRKHDEREAAFWLELGLSQDPTTFPEKSDLLNRIRRMEMILYDLLGKAAPNVSRSLNDWLNYVANTGESINEGYWIDAKILMSRAVDSSEEALSNVGSMDIKTKSELQILRTETLRDFDELMKASFRLRLPERRLDSILAVQRIHLRMLREQRAGSTVGDVNLIRFLVERLATAEKLLLQDDSTALKAKVELEQTLKYLEDEGSTIEDGSSRRWAEGARQELRRLLQNESRTS